MSTPFVAAGYSQGRHVQDDDRFQALLLNAGGNQDTQEYLSRTWATARWINLEVGYERLLRDGLLLRFCVGGAFLLDPDQSVSEARPTEPTRDGITFRETTVLEKLPYFGFGLGQAF